MKGENQNTMETFFSVDFSNFSIVAHLEKELVNWKAKESWRLCHNRKFSGFEGSFVCRYARSGRGLMSRLHVPFLAKLTSLSPLLGYDDIAIEEQQQLLRWKKKALGSASTTYLTVEA